MGFNKPETRGESPARNMPCGKAYLPQHFPSPVKEVFRDLIVSTGSVLAGRNRLQPDRLRALDDPSRRRQGLYVYVPASSAGANARLPVRKPPPRGSCKGCRTMSAIRLLSPVPLLMAGGAMNSRDSIRFLPFFVWLPYRGGCPSIEEAFICLFADRKRPQNQSLSRFCGLKACIHFIISSRAYYPCGVFILSTAHMALRPMNAHRLLKTRQWIGITHLSNNVSKAAICDRAQKTLQLDCSTIYCACQEKN